MTLQQMIVVGILSLALVLFIWGHWRYDLVALLALLVAVIAGVVPPTDAFAGFGHPAVVTVAAVLVVSRALLHAGAIDLVSRWMLRVGHRPTVQVGALTLLVIAISGVISSVAAVALLMPIAIQMARRSGNSPAILLMPLAFGSLLGATLTLIGSAPNLIVSSFRTQTGADPFRMFDYTPVGIGVAGSGIIFMTTLGWRLIPRREGPASRGELFQIDDYIAEVRVPPKFKLLGKPLRDLERVSKADVTIVGLVRDNQSYPAPSSFELMHAEDILLLEADPEHLKMVVDSTGLELTGSQALGEEALRSDEVRVVEVVVTPTSPMAGRTAGSLQLRWRYGLNLLAVSRQGRQLNARIGTIRLQVGDVLLLQGRSESLADALKTLGCLPLAQRALRLGQPRRMLVAVSIFGAALATASTGVLPVPIAFVAAAMVMVLADVLPLREAYASIDGPIIVLLGALLPVGQALESTGGAEVIAGQLLRLGSWMPTTAALVVLFATTMFLSDLINNAAAAVLMAPIAINVAEGLDVSADPLLMSVAIGASCAFLTPIGHQSNTLVLGPGGYRFSDYWRVGLGLEAVILVVAVPLILWFWPL